MSADKSQKTISLLSNVNTTKLNDLISAFASRSASEAHQVSIDLVSAGTTQSQILGFVVYAFRIISDNILDKRKKADDDEEFRSFDHKRFHKFTGSFDIKFMEQAFLELALNELPIKRGTIPLFAMIHALAKRDFSCFKTFTKD